MLKIVVFGAGGRAGSTAVAEARARGHEVTALVQAAADITDPAAVAAGAAGHDVAIAAAADAGDPAGFFRDAAESLVAGLTETRVNRLVWVSLASLLPTANGTPLMDTPGFPTEYRPFSLAHRAALDILRSSDLEWVAVSPSGHFDLEGKPAGTYHLAPGGLEEHITYADHARALIDEAERAQFRRTHIGVAS